MNWQSLPPLPALRAFAAFAETGSLAAAGAALNVSHAAISQQLRLLERHMGVALLDRSSRALSLTPDGRRLAQIATESFGRIGQVTAELTGADAERPVMISTTPTFAAAWLMPRLAELRVRHPDIDLVIDPGLSLAELAPGGVDIALRYGRGDWPGLQAECLLNAPMVVVAAPDLIAGRKISGPADLVDLPWVEELGRSEATEWLGRMGIARENTKGGIRVPGNLLLDGARNGQGVVVTVRPFAAADLKAGRLVELFCEDRDAGYYIVTRPGVHRPPVRDVLRWLRRQIGVP